MATRTNGGIFDNQTITGSMRHFVLEGADFSGAIDQYGRPTPFSAAEIIFINITEKGSVNIINPTSYNISFALESDRSDWDGPSLTQMVRGLGNNVGIDHIDLTQCTVTEVPYIWNLGGGGATRFTLLSDVPSSYNGKNNYAVVVDSTATGLTFVPNVSTAFSAVNVSAQPTVYASGSDTLTFVAGDNVNITTNAINKSVKIEAINALVNYEVLDFITPVAINVGHKYFVSVPGTVTLPSILSNGIVAGKSIVIAKKNSITVTVQVNNIATEVISTDLGNTDSLEFDATQEVILICDGVSSWSLQIGTH